MPQRRETLGTRLRRLRDAAGLTQQQLANQAGLSISAVALMEIGHKKDPRLSTLLALSRALGVTLNDLAEDLDEGPPPAPEPKRRGKK
jgi:transcriptional regulator with XRE-family HTH domain